jgi:D-cysteine desulfhydrase
MELAAQIEKGDLPLPDRIVLPLASGGTSAGLLLGLKIAGLDIEVVGARVGPRLFVNRYAVLHLARRTRALIRSVTGEDPGDVTGSRFRIVQHVYAGAYGRPLPAASEAANILQESAGIRLDDTYSAKAWVAALDESRSAGGPVLFWLTFDARCLTN